MFCTYVTMYEKKNLHEHNLIVAIVKGDEKEIMHKLCKPLHFKLDELMQHEEQFLQDIAKTLYIMMDFLLHVVCFNKCLSKSS